MLGALLLGLIEDVDVPLRRVYQKKKSQSAQF